MKFCRPALFAAMVPRGVQVSFPVSAPKSSYDATRQFRETEAAAFAAEKARDARGFFNLPDMDYPVHNGIAPFISAKQFSYTYEVYHRDVVDRLNKFVSGSPEEGHTIDVVIRSTSFDATRNVLHTAACEHFNYCMSYRSVMPFGSEPSDALKQLLHVNMPGLSKHDTMQGVCDAVHHAALSLQSRQGWVYLVWNGQSVTAQAFDHGSCPMAIDLVPLACINIHEHAYALDYSVAGTQGVSNYVRNALKAFNWVRVHRHLAEAASGK